MFFGTVDEEEASEWILLQKPQTAIAGLPKYANGEWEIGRHKIRFMHKRGQGSYGMCGKGSGKALFCMLGVYRYVYSLVESLR